VGKWRGDRLNLLEFLGFLGKVERKREVERKNRAFLPPISQRSSEGSGSGNLNLMILMPGLRRFLLGACKRGVLFILGRRSDCGRASAGL
jgi:hypothetical protein